MSVLVSDTGRNERPPQPGAVIPRSWLVAKISDVADVQGGKRLPKGAEFSDKQTRHPYLRVTDFRSQTIDTTSVKYIDEDIFLKIRNYTIGKDDLYISIAGTIGLVGTIPDFLDGANLTENAAKLCNIKGIHKRFLQGYLNSVSAQNQFEDKTVSSGQPKLALFRIRDCDFPLPPLAEQKIIAAKLDELLAQVDTLKTRLDTIPKILKRFRQSVLSAAVSGRLTEDWRDSPKYDGDGYPLEWTTIGLGNIGRLERGKSKHRPRNDPRLFGDKYPFVQTGEVANASGIIMEANKFYSDFGLLQSKIFPKGTLCITIAANIADTAILGLDACFPDSVVGFTADQDKCQVRFVKYLIDVNKEHLEAFAPATAQKNINLKVLNELKFPLPNLLEQTEIVRRVEQLFTYADQIEQQVKHAQARVNHLTQSILAKAFRGELTAEWRTQNPELISGENSAEALLARIKAERDAISSKKTTRKKAKA